MARLTKAQKLALDIEQAEFEIMANMVRCKGYSLHRMIGLHPYCVRAGQIGTAAYEGTLRDIGRWLESQP